MLLELDLDKISEQLKAEIAELIEKERDRESEGQKRARAVKRLEVVEAPTPNMRNMTPSSANWLAR